MEEDRETFTIAKTLIQAGRVREKLEVLSHEFDDIDLSKHNELWYTNDEKTDDFLWKLRGILDTTKEELFDMMTLLDYNQ